MKNELLNNDDFDRIYINLKKIIDDSKVQIVKKVNNIITLTYWNIGKLIKENIISSNRTEYGEST